MLRNTRLQAAGVLAVGALFGYLAANGRLTPFLAAQASQPPALKATAPPSGVSTNQEPTCCQEVGQERLVALAGPRAGKMPDCSGCARKPNILFIMGDDIGWFQVGAYHRGIMSGKTPNLDKLASQGMIFTDYYAEASCTAGRANFITGEIPLRTGLTTVGQAGADVGIPAQACTLATALKPLGYTTGQFGKNHLGDLNKFLPTVHGFDEFFGYLYHLDAMSDPYWYLVPERSGLSRQVRSAQPRPLLRRPTRTTRPKCRAGAKSASRRSSMKGRCRRTPICPTCRTCTTIDVKAKYDMTTFDEVLVKNSCEFMDKAKKDGKPFFLWHNTTRMHVWTFLSKKYGSMQNSKTNYGLEEAGMAQLDDCVGDLMKHLDDIGEADNTIVVFTTDNGAETFTWPDGGNTPFKGQKGNGLRRWLPRAVHRPLAGQDQAADGRKRALLRPRLVPDADGRRRQSEHHRRAAQGRAARRSQPTRTTSTATTSWICSTGKGRSKRHELFYFAGPKLGALRLDDFKFQFFVQPHGLAWAESRDRYAGHREPPPGSVRALPDDRRRIGADRAPSATATNSIAREFWRFVLVQQKVAELAKTAIDYPPMQDPASFNLEAVKKQIDEMIKAKAGNNLLNRDREAQSVLWPDREIGPQSYHDASRC